MVLLAYIAWASAAALKFSTVARMCWNGLVKRFPLIAIFLGFCATRSLLLMYLRPHQQWYRTVSKITLPFGLMAEGAAILAVFWAVAVNYPSFRKFGSVLLSILGIGGALAAWATYSAAIPQGTVRDALLLWQQSTSIFMVIILAGSRLALPRSSRIPIPNVAQRAADIFLLDVILGVLGAYIGRQYGFQHPIFTYIAPLVADTGVAILWLVVMSPVEEYLAASPGLGKRPGTSPGDLTFESGR